MPNQPATQNRSIRFPEELWSLVETAANEDGATYTDVVLDAVRTAMLARQGYKLVGWPTSTPPADDEPRDESAGREIPYCEHGWYVGHAGCPTLCRKCEPREYGSINADRTAALNAGGRRRTSPPK